MLKESMIIVNYLQTFTSKYMSSQTNIMDKDQLINDYVTEVIDGMDLKDCLAVLHDFMTDSYKDYTIEEVKEEVEEYYPHLLED